MNNNYSMIKEGDTVEILYIPLSIVNWTDMNSIENKKKLQKKIEKETKVSFAKVKKIIGTNILLLSKKVHYSKEYCVQLRWSQKYSISTKTYQKILYKGGTF